jgi:acetolactate synthase I/II/III large subunit
MTSSVGEIIVAAMACHGVDYAFCVPGESYLPVLDAFHDEPRVKPVATHHEEGAGFMAHAWSRATGRTGVVMVTRGPGITHLAVALHAARQDSVPLVAIAGQVPRPDSGPESFQEMDLVRFGELTGKAGIEITHADRAGEQIQRAFYLAASGRPGPVVVSLAEDLGYDRTTEDGAGPQPVPAPAADPGALGRAAGILRTARSAAIIAGGGISSPGGRTALVELAEHLGAVVYNGWRRFDAFPNTHPQFAGNLPWLPAEVTEALRGAEVILAVGTRMGDLTTLNYAIPGAGQRLVQIDLSPESIAATRDGDVALVGEARAACTALLRLLADDPGDAQLAGQRRQGALEAGHRFATRSAPGQRTVPDDVVDIAAAITTLRDLLPPEAAITSDAGSFAGYLNRYYRWREPRTFFGTTSGSMGYAVPAAIGAKLADPGRPVVAVAGDGGFTMTMSEVHTAVRLGLGGLVFVVLDNGVYGMIKNHQRQKFPGRDIAIDLTSADLSQVAIGLGAAGVRVSTDAEFVGALKEAVAAPVPTVIQAICSPDQISAWAG